MDQLLAEVERATGKKVGSGFGILRRRSDTDHSIDVLLLSDRPLNAHLQRLAMVVATERGLGLALWPVTPGYQQEPRGDWIQDAVRIIVPQRIAYMGYPDTLYDAWPDAKVKVCADVYAALDTSGDADEKPNPVEKKMTFERVAPPPPPELPPLEADREIGRGIVVFKERTRTIHDFFGKKA